MTRPLRMRIARLLTVVALAGLGTVALAGTASAHNVLIDTSPKAGASVTAGPTQIRFDFNSPVEQGENNITVLGPNGTHWERSETATVLGNSVSTPVAPLGPAGVYTASYRIISTDGHPVTGDITFTLTRAGTGRPVTLTAAASASGGGGMPIWVWIVAAIIVLGGVLFFVLRSGGQKEESGR
jgi:methionine-rich copper-binding protein CopC